jgi:predicted HTH transcriptional regulator
MNINIKQILQQGEGISAEFKKSTQKLPESLFQTICAFLNRNGGVILLGIDDNKNIIGVDEKTAPALCKDIANLSNNPQKLFPSFLLDVQLVVYKKKTLIHVFVPASSQLTKNANKPHTYGRLLPETFQPYPKNPHIAAIFTQMGRSEELGTGLRRVYKYSKEYSGSQNIFFQEEDVFIQQVPPVEKMLYKEPDIVVESIVMDNNTSNVIKKSRGESKSREKIIKLIKANKYITKNEIAELIGLSLKGVEKNIRQLKDNGLIKRIGPNKGGYWEITND